MNLKRKRYRNMTAKIKKILVPLDGSKKSFEALDHAIYVARQCGATITGICVTPLYSVSIGRLLTSLRNESLKEIKKFMAQAKRICAQNGIVFSQKILYGNMVSEITDYASYRKFDLIVMGSRGMSKAKELFLGSVANYVVHNSKVPVLLIK